MSITKISSVEQYDNFLKKHSKTFVHFTLEKSEDEDTNEVVVKLAKFLETLADKYPAVTFGSVDLQNNEEIAKTQKIAALSTFKGYIQGQISTKFSAYEEEDIEKYVENFDKGEANALEEIFEKAKFDQCLKDNEFVVVDFTALWCGPCRYIGPKFEALAKKQAETSKNLLDGEQLVTFVKVDADEAEEIKKSAEINCFPTFKYYKNGTEVDKLEGADEEALALKIKTMLNPEYKEVHYAEFVETKENFDKVIAETEIVIVDFTASWCPPCKMIKPVFEELAKEHQDNAKIKLIKIDVDENSETSEACEIKSMPTFMVYKNGEKVEEWGGANEAKLREKVKEYTS